MPTGSLLTIASAECMPAMEFYSTMKVRRGETFVTRKITRGLARMAGPEDCLFMGNLDSLRDWGHARDYVMMQWLMLQQDKPEDYVFGRPRVFAVCRVVGAAARVGINEMGRRRNI